jgi:hypothetical protein
MEKQVLCAAFALSLAACAATEDQQANAVQTAPPSAISVIGTPFYIALKIPVCAATVPMAGILAGLAQLSTPESPLNQYGAKAHADDAVIENCGPPYVVTP